MAHLRQVPNDREGDRKGAKTGAVRCLAVADQRPKPFRCKYGERRHYFSGMRLCLGSLEPSGLNVISK